MRSSRSKLKPGVQTAKPSTNDPRSEVRFIERRLLYDGTIELAHVQVRPDYVSAGRSASGTRSPAARLDRRTRLSQCNARRTGCANTGRPGVRAGRCRHPARILSAGHFVLSAEPLEPVRANRWPDQVRSGST